MSDDAETEVDQPRLDREEPTDEEQTETEWHLWLGALVLVGAVLIVMFEAFRLELAVALVAVVAFVWLLKTFIEKGE